MNDAKKIVLVVEDDDFISTFLVEQLNSVYQTIVAPDTAKAETALAEHKVDMIVLDLILPQEDGFALLERLKQADSPYKNIPVVVLSNLDQRENMDKAKELGAVVYLVKGNLLPDQIVNQLKIIEELQSLDLPE